MAHILLIEDNTEIRENIAEILELAGYSVATAENGKAGIESALAQKPDVIICDVMMPVLDGYGVLHLVQKNKDLTGIPFIFLTAKAERSDFRKGMEMGADDYITKPFNDIEILNAVESRIKKIELLKKEFESGSNRVETLLENFCGKQALELLTQNGNVNNYKKKQVIYTEGNYPVRLFILKRVK